MAESSGLYGGVSSYSTLHTAYIFTECSTYDIFILKKARVLHALKLFFFDKEIFVGVGVVVAVGFLLK